MVQKIIGHESSIKILNALLIKGVRSFLLVGPEGIGKKTVACFFAKEILCLEKRGRDCSCLSCVAFEKRISPDFKFLKIESKFFKIEQIAELQEACSSRPKFGEKKVFIIPCAHKMTSAASNSLLKILEEPPEHVIIFLVSENLNQILPTIRSRCVKVDFKLLREDQVKEVLLQQGYDQNIDLAAQLSFGTVKKAISCLSGSSLKVRDRALSLLINIQNLKLYQIFEYLDEVDVTFIDFLHLILYDFISANSVSKLKNSDRTDEIRAHLALFNFNFLSKFLGKITFLKYKLRFNIDLELHFAQMLLELKALYSKYSAC